MNAEGGNGGGFRTGMAQSLMREISRLLGVLAKTGESGALDLRSLPMTDADREELAERLGRGEVDVLFEVAGTSEAFETSYAGVWWVRHFGANEQVAAERIEIAPLPEILTTSDADIAAAAARLKDDLGSEAVDETKRRTHG